MSDHSLKPLTSLGYGEARTDTIGPVTITEEIDYALASIAIRAGKEKPFAAAAKKALKISLPGPGAAVTNKGVTVFWTSPDQWFVEAPLKSHEDIASVLLKDFKESASVTEQTGGWVRFDLEGEGCISVMERICAVDGAAMETDAATRSVIEHIGVFVVCRDAQTGLSIYGPRSSAGSLHHALLTAAKSALS